MEWFLLFFKIKNTNKKFVDNNIMDKYTMFSLGSDGIDLKDNLTLENVPTVKLSFMKIDSLGLNNKKL